MPLLAAIVASAFLLPPPASLPRPRRTSLPRMDVESGADWASAAARLSHLSPPGEDEPCELSPLDFCDMLTGNIVFLRHGESEWNAGSPRFTGWTDVGLSNNGVEQAKDAGKTLLDQGICFEQAFVSNLKRTIKTAWVVLETLDSFTVPVTQSWRLNERMYGALTGLDKKETEVRTHSHPRHCRP